MVQRQLRWGSYFPAWLLERRRRAEKALVAVVAESYLLGAYPRSRKQISTGHDEGRPIRNPSLRLREFIPAARSE
jgi:hypothetical protein